MFIILNCAKRESPLMMPSVSVVTDVSSTLVGNVAVVYAENYLNKVSGERIEYECRNHISDGYKSLIICFRNTQIVNSVGISILIGIIEAAKESGSRLIFAEVNEQTCSLFEMLGLTRHVSIAKTEQDAFASIVIENEIRVGAFIK